MRNKRDDIPRGLKRKKKEKKGSYRGRIFDHPECGAKPGAPGPIVDQEWIGKQVDR